MTNQTYKHCNTAIHIYIYPHLYNEHEKSNLKSSIGGHITTWWEIPTQSGRCLLPYLEYLGYLFVLDENETLLTHSSSSSSSAAPQSPFVGRQQLSWHSVSRMLGLQKRYKVDYLVEGGESVFCFFTSLISLLHVSTSSFAKKIDCFSLLWLRLSMYELAWGS